MGLDVVNQFIDLGEGKGAVGICGAVEYGDSAGVGVL